MAGPFTRVTKFESQALLVLAPGVFIRAGVRCPHCRHEMQARHRWQVKDTTIDWIYLCERCGTELDRDLRIADSLKVWMAVSETPARRQVQSVSVSVRRGPTRRG